MGHHRGGEFWALTPRGEIKALTVMPMPMSTLKEVDNRKWSSFKDETVFF